MKSIFDGAQSIACAYRVNSPPIPVVSHSDDDVQRKRWLGLDVAFRKVVGACGVGVKQHQHGEIKPPPPPANTGFLKKTKRAAGANITVPASTALRRGLNGRCTSSSRVELRTPPLALGTSPPSAGLTISILCRGATVPNPLAPEPSSGAAPAAAAGFTIGLSNCDKRVTRSALSSATDTSALVDLVLAFYVLFILLQHGEIRGKCTPIFAGVASPDVDLQSARDAHKLTRLQEQRRPTAAAAAAAASSFSSSNTGV